MALYCPACGHEMTCPCKPCQKRRSTEKPWIDLGYLLACGKCALVKSIDWWEDLSIAAHPIKLKDKGD